MGTLRLVSAVVTSYIGACAGVPVAAVTAQPKDINILNGNNMNKDIKHRIFNSFLLRPVTLMRVLAAVTHLLY